MMGQQTMTAAGGALRRIVLVVAMAALMALMMVTTAVPASAAAPQGEAGKAKGQCIKNYHQAGGHGQVKCVFL